MHSQEVHHRSSRVPWRLSAFAGLMLLFSTSACHSPAQNGQWMQFSRRVSPTGLPPMAEPSWSPDGAQLVMVSEEVAQGDIGNIYILDLRSGNARPITSSAATAYSHPAWSADGSLVGFVSTSLIPPGVWVVGTDGSGLRPVAGGWTFAWSPSGRRMAVGDVQWETGDALASMVITIVDIDSGPEASRTLLRAAYIYLWDMAWSPDGERIALALQVGEGPDVVGEYAVYLADSNLQSMHIITRDRSSTLNWLDRQTLLYQVLSPSPSGTGARFHEVEINGQCWEIQTTIAMPGAARVSPDMRTVVFSEGGIVYTAELRDWSAGSGTRQPCP